MPKIGWRKVYRDGVDGKAVDVMLSANMTDVASGILYKLIAGAAMCVPCIHLPVRMHACMQRCYRLHRVSHVAPLLHRERAVRAVRFF